MRIPTRRGEKNSHAATDPRLTEEKFQALQRKLEHLKETRFTVAREVQHLAHDGDFSENAGYQAAKGRLRGINQRILDIETQLNHAQIIQAPGDTSTVQIGHHVTIDLAGKKSTYQILGSTETDPTAGIISHRSPIGAALLGHRVGETVTFNSATKTMTCTIIEISN